MSIYAWIIDSDLTEQMEPDQRGGGRPELLAELRADPDGRCVGKRFLLSDSDGVPFFLGRLLNRGTVPAADFAPLGRLGRGWGCTELHYQELDEHGRRQRRML